MVRIFEVELDVPPSAAQAWSLQHEPSRRAGAAESLDIALVNALAQLPRAVLVPNTDSLGTESRGSHADGAQVTTTCFDGSDKLTVAGMQVTLDTSPAGRRVAVVQRACYSPGVTLCEILYEAPLEADAPMSEAFAAAPDKLRHTLGDVGNFVPLATRTSMRHHWQWSAENGIVVDIVLDRAVAPAQDGAPLRRELRLTTAYVADDVVPSLTALFAVANALVAAVPAFPVLRPVLDRMRDAANTSGSDARDGSTATATATRAAPINLTAISTPHAALAAIGDNLADHWFGNDAGVRDAVNTEFVHQMRVAQRRLRTALRIFPHWADEAWQTRIAPDLKWLGSVLGDARDWDVFVDSTLPALAAVDTDRAGWDATRERAATRRLEARERVQTALASARYAHLALAWLEWLSGLPSREPPVKAAGHSLRAYANKRVASYYKRLADAPKLTTLDEASRHKERIQAKYLRYALEFFESIASRKTRSKSAKTVARMQSVLGDGNDAAVALRFLAQIDAPPYQSGFAQGWCEASKRYTAQEGELLLRRLRKPKITGGAAG